MEVSTWVYSVTLGSLTNGPGRRNILHVTGCSIHCPGCFSKHMWKPKSGTLIHNQELATQLLQQDPEGISISGGEPLDQSSSLLDLLERLPRNLPKGILLYTGTNTIQRKQNPLWPRIAALIDVAVAGPYDMQNAINPVKDLRSSHNQRVLLLSNKLREKDLTSLPSVEYLIGTNGMTLMGFPGATDVGNQKAVSTTSEGH